MVVAGEVLFSGSYSLLKKNERLSDLVSKAGGVTPDAYVKGARLIRKLSDEERRRQNDAIRMAQNGEGKDSISIQKLNLSLSRKAMKSSAEKRLKIVPHLNVLRLHRL